jgi:hypothetical protein
MCKMIDRIGAHKVLCQRLEHVESVHSIDYRPPNETDSGLPETEVLVESTGTDTIPNSLIRLLPQYGVGMDRGGKSNYPDLKLVRLR